MASVWEKTSDTKPRLNIFAIRDLDSLQAPGYDSVNKIRSGVEPCQLVKVIKFGKAIKKNVPMVCTWRLFVNVLFPYEEGLLTNAHICSQNMDSSLIYQLKFV